LSCVAAGRLVPTAATPPRNAIGVPKRAGVNFAQRAICGNSKNCEFSSSPEVRGLALTPANFSVNRKNTV